MKTLYLECNMGASGDMLMGALYELLSDSAKDAFIKNMNSLFPNQLMLSASPSEKCGIWGTKMNVVILGQEETSERVHNHLHTGYQEMLEQIGNLPVSASVKEHAKAVYTLIGNAESAAHHTDISQIHFHEVGTLDAIMDVVGCCLLIELLNPEQIIASPIHVGSGSVRCAHGILPVPAPATAELLKDIPIYGGSIDGELCTPTGAALLKHFSSQFTPMPPMTVEQTGYGMGAKDFDTANCLRAFWGNLSILPVPSPRQLPGYPSAAAVKSDGDTIRNSSTALTKSSNSPVIWTI